MAIDIRAISTCTLGNLISASISDDYLQGSGLIKTQGTCVISGIITPEIGTIVRFSYEKRGLVRTIPRTLRVLSSFANPYEKTTEVQLGCKLTYLQDKADAVDWEAIRDGGSNTAGTSITFADPGGPAGYVNGLPVAPLPPASGAWFGNYEESDEEIIVVPISANDIAVRCLTELELQAFGLSLTNRFSIDSFDLSGGYVNVLSNLLVSEGYCGYIDRNEKLQIFSLDQPGGSGPVFGRERIISAGEIGVGQLPGDAVIVNYSTLKLKPPEAIDQGGGPGGGIAEGAGWDQSSSVNIFKLPVPYDFVAGGGRIFATKIYNISEVESTTTVYGFIGSGSEEKRVKVSQTSSLSTQSPAIAGGLVSEYLKNGIGFSSVSVSKTTIESYRYDREGNQVYYERSVSGSPGYIIGSLGLKFVFSRTDYVTANYAGSVPIERETQSGLVSGTYKNVKVNTYGTWFQTIQGQQTIAASQGSFTNAAEVSTFLNAGFDGSLHLIDSRQVIETNISSDSAPSDREVNLSKNVDDGGSSANNYQTESKSEVELVLGSSTAQLRTEFSMPYAPDDVFSGPPGGPYTSVASDAPQKARNFGLTQNRLLLGNRFGMGIQTAPEWMPEAPFSPVVISVEAQNGLYRTNGMSWTMNNEGVIASIDALLWGGAGGTGQAWFGSAPGVSTTAPPPIVDETAPVRVIGTIGGISPGALVVNFG